MTKSLNDLSDDQPELNEAPPSRETLIARLATRPSFLGAHTISRFNRVMGNVGLFEIAAELHTEINRIQKGDLGRTEETLATQAIVLDTLFNILAVKSLNASGSDMQSTLLKLALQSQRQCCLTIEALSAIKKPAAVTVVRQTNIGQAVQVNNSATDETTQPILENEVLENNDGKRLDYGTQITSSTINQDLAAMEKLDRPQKRSRKGQSIS